MAINLWSALTNGQTIAFDPVADVLSFDNAGIQAAAVNFVWNNSSEVTVSLSGNATAALNKTITLTVAGGGRALTDTNVVFANGSKLLIGDNAVNVGSPGSGLFDEAGNSLVGTAGNDRLMGLGGNDTLDGGAGNDLFILGNGAFAFGNDSVIGGAGNQDFIGVGNQSQITHGSTVDFRIHQVISAQGTAVFTGMEGAFGTQHNDTFIAFDPDRVLSQHVLRDFAMVLRGFSGNDTFIGDNQLAYAAEIVSYTEAPAGVSVNLATGIASDGYGFTDTLVAINGVQGSAFNDVLKAGGTATGFITRFEFIEGLGGNDIIDGNGGPTVRATYNMSPAGVTVNLATGTASDGWGGTDTLIGINQISGSFSPDSLTGDGNDNFLEGRQGNDTLDGGGGSDMISFQNASSAIDVDLSLGSSSLTGGLGTDIWTSIEDIRGSDFGDTLRGTGGDNTFDPGPGADTMDGGGDSGDRVRYDRSPGAVQVNFAAGTALDGFDSDTVAAGIQSYTDTLISIEQVRGSVFADTFIGDAGNNVMEGWAGNDTMDGGAGGNDRADYRGSPSAVTVNLITGTASDGWGGTDTLSNIEDARGGRFNDLLIGSAVGNFLRGGQGADTLDGGAGFDFAEYANATAAVTVDLANPANNTGEAAGDVFIGIEALSGSDFNDVLTADGAINFLRGRGGADSLNGGAGFDYADYANASTGVTADLTTPASNTGDAAGDVYVSIEALRGSSSADVLIGDAGDNFLRGGGGADTLDGGAGGDTADYLQAGAGLVADLTTPGNNTGEAAGDVYISIERLRGGNFDDVLVGHAGRNVLRGGLGADTLDGGGATDMASYFDSPVGITADLGNPANNTGEAVGDVYISIEGLSGSAFNDALTGNSGQNFLAGNAGADTLNGGGGIDYADYTAAPAGVTASLANPASNTGDAAGDVYIAIEGFVGSPFNDTLIGDANQNFIAGGAGADALNGGAGSDFADYITAGAAVMASLTDPLTNTGDAAGDTYAGIEHLRGTPFNDTLVGDAGTNFLRGLGGADVLDGRAGFDYASYVDAPTGLTVDLNNPGNNTGDAAGDVFIGIEGLGGSFFDDLLVGDAGTNIIYSNDGADTVNGGGGLDFADYFFALTPVTASLADSSVNTGVTAIGDVYISIEGLRGGAFNDTLIGNSGTNFLRGGLGADALDGGAGDDFADYFDATAGITVDLSNPGNNTGEAVGDTYTGIEHLRGGSFNDTLAGDGGRNILRGGAGADVLDGRGGIDFASYSDAVMGLTVDLGKPANNTGEALGDTFIGIEGLGGSQFADLLIGDGANNLLGGHDGADTLNGGAGFDYADYSASFVGITASLTNPASNAGANAIGDAYISIEGLIGSNLNDTLIGDAASNFLRGLGGADTLDGGAGLDTADYFTAAAGLTVDLSTPANNTGEAAGDVYISMENVRGSSFNDTLIGNAGANVLRGGLGADVLNGGGTGGPNDAASYFDATTAIVASLADPSINTGEAFGDTYISIEVLAGSAFGDMLIGDGGNNVLHGAGGADTLNGGAGSDRAAYDSATTGITASLSNTALNTGDAAGDVYISIENLYGSAFDDTLIGDAGANGLHGGLGGFDFADYRTAAAGVTANLANAASNAGEAAGDVYTSIEALAGSAFADVLTGDAGDNELMGGAGADTLDGGGGVDFALYSSVSSGVVVNLADETANTGDAAGDVFTSIEGIVGTAFADVLIGDAGDNILDGLEGNDTINGGAGNDTAVFGGLSTEYTKTKTATGWIVSGFDGVDVLTGIEFLSFDDDTIALVNVPTVVLGAGADTVTGGDSVDVIDGGGGDDSIAGGAGSDKLLGGTGSDTLDGGNGNDKLSGGVGDDVMIGGAGDNLMDGGAGTGDVVILDGQLSDYRISIVDGPNTSKLFFTLIGLEPGDVVNLVSADGRVNRLAGVEKIRFGDDSEFELSAAFLADAPKYVGATYLVDKEGDGQVKGTKGDDVIDGLDGDDSKLEGLAGNDVIDGGDGADTMIGGAGNDTYIVDDAGDVVTEAAGQGTDAIRTALAVLSLADYANIERLEYTGAGSFTGTGNALANLLKGGLGNDTLDGGAGVDRLEGGAGDDTYVVTAGDVVFEGTTIDAGGTDTVSTAVTYTLVANVENLVLTGTANLNGTGNTKANALTGNDGNNVLSGGDGADTLNGGIGNDNLNGGSGNDVLVASAGNDTFTGGAGNDTLDLSAMAFAFADKGVALRIERPDMGTIRITHLDADPDQVLTIKGAWGAASGDKGIESFVFSDRTVTLAELIVNTASPLGETYSGGGDGDTFDASAGNDNLAGMEGSDALSGGAGNDSLDGGDGADTMSGGLGNDTYMVDIGDVVSELAGQGTDHVRTALAEYTLAEQVEQLTYTGTGTFTGTGNALGNIITGGAGSDLLDGGAGADRMVGKAGDDTYVVDHAGDSVSELASEGSNDTIRTDRASLSLVATNAATLAPLFANVENLVYIGAGNFAGTGSAAANQITGGAGNDNLSGAAGDDTLTGGGGADTLNGGAGTDVARFAGTKADYSYSLLPGDIVQMVQGDVADRLIAVERVVFDMGTADTDDDETYGVIVPLDAARPSTTWLLYNVATHKADNLIGSASAETIDGGAGNDTIDGGAGADTLTGGLGNDVFVLDSLDDVVIELAGAANGIDTVRTALLSMTLDGKANVERLEYIGEDAFSGTGSAFADVIVGGAGADTLNGGLGKDTLTGGAGADRFDFTATGAANVDTISDFDVESDGIGLDSDAFSGLVDGALEEGAFVSGAGRTTAADASDRIIYNTTTGALYFDVDGAGGAAAIQFATLTGSPDALSAADFSVI